MPDTLQEWAKLLVGIEVPVMSSTRAAIVELGRKQNSVSAAEIAAVILPDPMMTLRLMRLANDRPRKGLTETVGIIQHAVMLLGMTQTFTMLGRNPVVDGMPDKAARVGLHRVAARSYHAARQARDFGILRIDVDVEEMYIAALMHDVAELLLWAAAPDRMKELDKARRNMDFEAAEQELFGFHLSELSLALVQKWYLTDLAISALQPEECERRQRSRLVMQVSRLARHAELGWYDAAVQADLEGLAQSMKLPVDDITARVHRVAAAAARDQKFPGVVPAAAWLPMLPGPWPEEAVAEAPLVPQPEKLEKAITEMASHRDGSYTLHDLVVQVIKGMREGIGLRRVVFALLTKDRAQLRARYVVGAAEDEPLKQFHFEMQQPHLFSKLMSKQAAIWLKDDNRAQLAPFISEEIQRVINVDQFFAMSIGVHGKVLGMFYADCGEAGSASNDALNAAGYESFKKLCGQAALGMGHLAKS